MRQKGKTGRSKNLANTGRVGGRGDLRIWTRIKDERFESGRVSEI